LTIPIHAAADLPLPHVAGRIPVATKRCAAGCLMRLCPAGSSGQGVGLESVGGGGTLRGGVLRPLLGLCFLALCRSGRAARGGLQSSGRREGAGLLLCLMRPLLGYVAGPRRRIGNGKGRSHLPEAERAPAPATSNYPPLDQPSGLWWGYSFMVAGSGKGATAALLEVTEQGPPATRKIGGVCIPPGRAACSGLPIELGGGHADGLPEGDSRFSPAREKNGCAGTVPNVQNPATADLQFEGWPLSNLPPCRLIVAQGACPGQPSLILGEC
jgi:hypothetical protein